MSDDYLETIVQKYDYTPVEKTAIRQAWEALIEIIPDADIENAKLYISSLLEVEYRAAFRAGQKQMRDKLQKLLDSIEY